jgi:hypothetical protein
VGILAVAGTLVLGRPADAQYATTIPLKPWTADYDSYVYPIVPNNAAIPNASRYMQPSGGPNQLNEYYGQISNNMEAAMSTLPADAPDVRGRMVPYTSAFRRFDREFKRVYQPNREVDAKYYQARNKRDELYIQATTASDPRTRTEAMRKLREFDEKNQSLVGYSRRREGPASRLPGSASLPARPSAPAPPPPSSGARVPAPAPPPPSAARVPAPAEPAGEVEPLFAQSYGGMPTLNPYTSRITVPRQMAAPRPGASRAPVPPPAPSAAPSPDDVLRRSRGMDIPPAPEP